MSSDDSDQPGFEPRSDQKTNPDLQQVVVDAGSLRCSGSSDQDTRDDGDLGQVLVDLKESWRDDVDDPLTRSSDLFENCLEARRNRRSASLMEKVKMKTPLAQRRGERSHGSKLAARWMGGGFRGNWGKRLDLKEL